MGDGGGLDQAGSSRGKEQDGWSGKSGGGVGAQQLSSHRCLRVLQLRGQHTLSRKGQVENSLGFAGVQVRVTIAGLMLLSGRAYLQRCLLTGLGNLPQLVPMVLSGSVILSAWGPVVCCSRLPGLFVQHCDLW